MTKITVMKRSSTPSSAASGDFAGSSAAAAAAPIPNASSSGVGGNTFAPKPLPPDHQPCADPAASLAQLNAALQKAREARPHGALARAHSAQLLNDEHKKGFLLAEDWVVKAAAERMVAYWDARARLFGEEKMLCAMDRSGTLKGEDSPALDQGMLQILPEKDAAGRTLLYYDPSRHDANGDCSTESLLRVAWYILHLSMTNPSDRERGVVLLVHPNRCAPEQIHRDFIARGLSHLGAVLPFRWRGFHLCHPCPSYNSYFPLVKMLAPRRMQDEVVVHFGSEEHVMECLEKYGVAREKVPAELGGGVQLDYAAWLAERKRAEGEDALRAPSPKRLKTSASSSDVSPQPAAEMEDGGSAQMEDVGSSSQGSVASAPAAAAAAASLGVASPGGEAKSSKTKRPGRKGDSRMHRSVQAKLENAEASLVEALQEGGFHFEGINDKGRPHHEVFDQDGVSLMQRKNQLLRRIRTEKKKQQGGGEEKEGGDKK
ncbi:hypothetical protein ACHAXT_007880 [Thalassiosira profunda]